MDKKLTALTPVTTLGAADLLYAVTDPAGTPTSAAITYANLLAGINVSLAGLGAPISGFVDLAGQTRQMFRVTAGATAQNPIVTTQAGHLIGLSVVATAARTAGTAVFTATINGTDAALVATINGTTTNYPHSTAAVAFAAGDRLSVRHADSGFTPSTNFEATLWVVYA